MTVNLPPSSVKATHRHDTRDHQRGTIISATLIFIIILAVAAGGVLSVTLTSYKLSKRNEIRARARALAESEMEVFFYKFREFLIKGEASYASEIPGLFAAMDDSVYNCDATDIPTTPGKPYAKIFEDKDALDTLNLEQDDWIVLRSVTVTELNPELSPPDKYIIEGIIPATTKTGKFSYLVARVEVKPGPSNPLYGKVSVRIGRRLSYATASVFQYNVFAQGDLEFAPGGNTIIEGDIAANGSIYMGASSGGTLRVNGYIRYLEDNFFNETEDGTPTYRKPGTFNPSTGTPVTADASSLTAPIFGTSQSAQVETMKEQENLLGGLDATSIALSNPALFGETDTDAEIEIAINNVYRSLIAPPPSAVASASGLSKDASGAEYPTTTNLISTPDNDSIAALRAYNRAGLIVTVNTSGAVVSIKDGDGVDKSSIIASSVASKSLYDQREGKTIAVTEIDVGALKTAIEASYETFNGLLYVHLANSNSSNPAAVRLVNAVTTPGSDSGTGFSVATNGGLYVQGSYNTTASTSGSINPTMLMADSVTILSDSWDDTNSSLSIDNRSASEGNTTINAGILTGNVAATAETTSGGGQNLVRFLEDWTGKSVTFKGSLGRLFNSKHFTAPFVQPGNVYKIPGLRTFSFNASLKTANVPGAPVSTYFSRGDFFTW